MYVLVFLTSIVLANLSAAYFGPIATPFNALILIGLDITLRDKLHENWSGNYLKLRMIGLIVVSAGITWLLNKNAGTIGIASVIAFTAALIVDTFIYQILIRRLKWQKMMGSNVCSALVDSVIFPTLAFGVFMPEIIVLQFLAKVLGGAMWIFMLSKLDFRLKGRQTTIY